MATIMQVGGGVGGTDKFYTITLPAGRMRGDVNGDGIISYMDVNLLRAFLTFTVDSSDYFSDDISVWCADYNGDGNLNAKDTLGMSKYILQGVVSSTASMSDYYNNWTFVNEKGTIGYFYIDIPVDGLTCNNSVFVFVEGELVYDTEKTQVISNGTLRLCVTRPPIEELNATIVVFPTGGEIIISADEPEPRETFIVHATGSAGSYVADKRFGEIQGAMDDGIMCVLLFGDTSGRPLNVAYGAGYTSDHVYFNEFTDTGIKRYSIGVTSNAITETTAALTFA